MRALLPLALFSFPFLAFPCVCQPDITPCNSDSPVVLVGRVIRDSGPGLGEGFARIVVEEVLRGLPKDTGELEVDTMAHTDCYMRLELGQRYVLFGDQAAGRRDLLENHPCAGSFRLPGHERLLATLRDIQTGGPPHLLGAVFKKNDQYRFGQIAGAGIRVVAQRDGVLLETRTDPDGQFDFPAISPGSWDLRVDSPGLVNSSFWPAGPLDVPAHGCALRNLSVAVDGRIRGTVRNGAGNPVFGVAVQAFIFNDRGELETTRFREATTGSDGSYELDALPPQQYVIAINGEKYADTAPYRPLFFPQAGDRNAAARIRLGEMERRDNINFTVDSPRQPAGLTVEAVMEDGTPAAGFGVRVEDPAGLQRSFLSGSKTADGVAHLSLWAGETYRINVWRFETKTGVSGNPVRIGVFEWEGAEGPLQLPAAGARIRVVLHPVAR